MVVGLNKLFFLLGLNLKSDPPSDESLSGLSRSSSKSIPRGCFFVGVMIVNVSISGVPGGLIKLPVAGGIHGLLSSLFNDKKFISGVFFGISKVFQGDILLSGVLLEFRL